MSAISLKIRIPEKNAVKTIQFDPSTLVYEACHLITDKIAEVNHGLGSGLFSRVNKLDPLMHVASFFRGTYVHLPLYLLCLFLASLVKDYGLFLVDEDPKKGVWLEAGRSLEYYMLRSGVCIVKCTSLSPVLILISLLQNFDQSSLAPPPLTLSFDTSPPVIIKVSFCSCLRFLYRARLRFLVVRIKMILKRQEEGRKQRTRGETERKRSAEIKEQERGRESVVLIQKEMTTGKGREETRREKNGMEPTFPSVLFVLSSFPSVDEEKRGGHLMHLSDGEKYCLFSNIFSSHATHSTSLISTTHSS